LDPRLAELRAPLAPGAIVHVGQRGVPAHLLADKPRRFGDVGAALAAVWSAQSRAGHRRVTDGREEWPEQKITFGLGSGGRPR
jgi:hypothetical protein